MTSPTLPTVASEWRSFERAIFTDTAGRPIPISEAQRIETRRAFYAGARSMFSLILACSPDEVSEEQGAVYLNALDKELTAFNEQVKAGQA